MQTVVYRADYNFYVYTDCNFICGLSDVITKAFSQSVSQASANLLYCLLPIVNPAQTSQALPVTGHVEGAQFKCCTANTDSGCVVHSINRIGLVRDQNNVFVQ